MTTPSSGAPAGQWRSTASAIEPAALPAPTTTVRPRGGVGQVRRDDLERIGRGDRRAAKLPSRSSRGFISPRPPSPRGGGSRIGLRNCPVKLSATRTTSSGVPWAITPPAAVAALGPEVDDPVGGLDHVEVVLDHHHRVAVVAQAVQHLEQQVDVVEVQARGGLVEDEERAPGVALGQLQRELHALRLAARRASWRSGPGGCSPGPPRAASRACARSTGTDAKNSCALSTVMSSTSAMERPL